MTRLSEAWSAFESLVKQAPPSQPLLLLATCHAPLDTLPPLLLRFFSCAPAASASTDAAGQPPAEAAAAAAPPSVVVIGDPSPEEWSAAVCREADSVAAGIAARTAAALRSRLKPRDAGEPGLSWQEQEQQEAGVQPGQQGAEQEGCSSDGKDGVADEQANAADLERGLALFAQLDASMRALGAALHADCRSDVAGARVCYGGGGGRPQRTAWCSFRGLAAHAQVGGYTSLEQLQSDAAATARKIAAAGAQQADAARSGSGGGSSGFGGGQLPTLRQRTAIAAACALQDEIDEHCHALRQALALDDPDNARVLRIASARHRAQQRIARAARRAEGAGQEPGSEPNQAQVEQQRWRAQQGEPMEEDGMSPGLHDGAAEQQHLEQQKPMAETAEQPDEQQGQRLSADQAGPPGCLPSFLAPVPTSSEQHVAAACAFQQELQRRLVGLLRSCMAHLPLPSSAAMQALQEASAVFGAEAGAACVAAVKAAVAEGAEGLESAGGPSALAAACSEAVQEMRLPWSPT